MVLQYWQQQSAHSKINHLRTATTEHYYSATAKKRTEAKNQPPRRMVIQTNLIVCGPVIFPQLNYLVSPPVGFERRYLSLRLGGRRKEGD